MADSPTFYGGRAPVFVARVDDRPSAGGGRQRRDFVGAMPQDDDDLIRAAFQQRADLALDERLAAPRQQRLRASHARAQPGG